MGIALRRQAAVAILLALLVISGCTDARPDDAIPRTPSSSAAPTTPSPTVDPHAAAKAEVLAAYRGFWRAATDAEARPNRKHPQLTRYATDEALAAEQATIVLYRQQGIVGRGEPRLSPEVVALNQQPGSAVIADCLDLTGVDAVYRSTGESAIAPGQSRRHRATATAVRRDGRWVIRELTADRKQPC